MVFLDSVLVLIVMHFVCDFVLQTDYMALNKSKSFKVLALHVIVYSIPFCIVFSPLFGVVNGVLHFVTDAISSRATSYLWKKEKRHWFFVVIGADQMVHMLCLVTTFYYLCLLC